MYKSINETDIIAETKYVLFYEIMSTLKKANEQRIRFGHVQNAMKKLKWLFKMKILHFNTNFIKFDFMSTTIKKPVKKTTAKKVVVKKISVKKYTILGTMKGKIKYTKDAFAPIENI